MQRLFSNIADLSGRPTGKNCKQPRSNRNNSIQPLLLTRAQISSILNMSESNAIKILAKHGVFPIDLGRGRGKGLRWKTSAVIEVADILHTEAQAKKCQRRKRTSAYSVRGKSTAQLFAEFNGSNSRKAEVCNGN